MTEARQKAWTKGPWTSSTDFMTNEGQRAVMAPSDELGRTRVALVDAHTKYKRGEGWKVECPEREANVCLIAAAPEMYDGLEVVTDNAEEWSNGVVVKLTHKQFKNLNAAMAKARGER